VYLAPGADPQQIAAAMKSLPNDVRVLTHAEFIQFEENYWKLQPNRVYLWWNGNGVLVG